MGGDYQRVCHSVKNMIANLTGMICDGAKPSCSLKISSGVSTAILSALLSMEGKCVTSAEGIIDDDVDKSIHNLTSIGADAMRATDDKTKLPEVSRAEWGDVSAVTTTPSMDNSDPSSEVTKKV